MEKFEIYTEAKRGGRNYMEDVVCVKVPKGEDRGPDGSLSLYLAVFDGHGGPEAAEFAKEHLFNEITKQKGFWTDDDEQVIRAIKDGFLSTHKLMWTAVDSWSKTTSGLASTAGTTASVVFVKNKKLYIAHVGDSSVVLGTKLDNGEEWSALSVTKEHKPDCPEELRRIHRDGGQVLSKAGIARVVWKRPRVAKGPVRRSTVVDNVPFLAIARSLGDLWSYDAERDVFVVSPEPDVSVRDLEDSQYPCIILASDGVWNMIKSEEAMQIVSSWNLNRKRDDNDQHAASVLVNLALERWKSRQIRADNTSAIVAFLNRKESSNVHSLLNCENSVAGRLNSPWISPSKPSFFPLHQNFRSSFVDAASCGTSKIGNIDRMHLSKEDRFGSKWRKLRRKSLPGLRHRLMSVGSRDARLSNGSRRRHTLPSVKMDSSFDLSGTLSGVYTNLLHEKVSEIPLKSSKDLQNTPDSVVKLRCVDSSTVGFDSPDDALCLRDLQHFNSLDSAKLSLKRESSPIGFPLVTGDTNNETVTDSCDLVSSPKSCSHDKPSSSVNLKRFASVYSKESRRRTESDILPAKRPCLELSPESCHSYRTRFHTPRLRIPVE